MSSALCTLEDVRLQMETRAADTALDDKITALIPIAQELIVDYTQREMFPAAAATRTLPLRGDRDNEGRLYIDAGPNDFRVVTSVTLDKGGPGERLLIARSASSDGEFSLLPVGADQWGVYSQIVLAPSIPLPTSVAAFGECPVQVIGDWGMTSVPNKAKQACIVTIRSWLRGDQNPYSSEGSEREQQPSPAFTYALPAAARKLCDNLRRIPL